jgi:hypothetical protein
MHPLVATAQEYVNNLRPENNRFLGGEAYLNRSPWDARTMCSSFIRLLINQVYDVSPVLFTATFSTLKPAAKDFHAAAAAGVIPVVTDILDVGPGHLGFIRYEELRNGFTGHSFLVVATPVHTDERFGDLEVWQVKVIDSARSSHGVGDTRFRDFQEDASGIGQGVLRLVTRDRKVVGYLWKGAGNSELLLNGKGQSILVAGIPPEWKPRA